MEADKIVKMANQIASFFEAEPDRAVVVESIASHLKRFWDPRMRREILRIVDEPAGDGLHDTVREAVRGNRERLTPVE